MNSVLAWGIAASIIVIAVSVVFLGMAESSDCENAGGVLIKKYGDGRVCISQSAVIDY